MKNSSTIGATLLITGCCIGAGMIGLPVVSALTGFMPSIVAMFLCYVFTTLSGLLLVEATLWFDKEVNLPSIVEFALGKLGKSITILLFLFLFYCLFVAYLDAGGTLFAEMIAALFNMSITHSIGILLCLAFVMSVTCAGTWVVDNANRYMLIGMIISYVLLVAIGLQHVKVDNLLYTNWSLMYGVVPILLISFGYQNLVPSIVYYLKRNVQAIRKAIIIGNFLPFMVYFIWEYVILGMLPTGAITTTDEVLLVTQLLQQAAIGSLSIFFIVKIFSLFAMLTSFIPSAISFIDFLKDGFRQLDIGSPRNNLFFYGLVFIPPAVCALIYPHLFLHALGFAGGFIDVLLFGVLPAAVIIAGRYKYKAQGDYQVVGGFITPIIMLIVSVGLLALKVLGGL